MTPRALLIPFALAVASQAAAQTKLVLFTGTVVDSTKRPIGNAEVSIAGLNLTRTTDNKGNFRFETVTGGIHQVTVRKIGYAQLDTSIAFPEDQDVEWRVTMREKIVTLDSVITRAPMEPWMEEFESNRKRGFGRFYTSAELRKMDGTTLPQVMRATPGTDIMRTNVGANFITSKRPPMSNCIAAKPRSDGDGGGEVARAYALEAQRRTDDCLRHEGIYYVPEATELQLGYRRACFPLVYVDNQLMNSGRPTPPFDVSQYATENIEAIEWFESQAQTPPKYSARQAYCGVLVLHMRRRK